MTKDKKQKVKETIKKVVNVVCYVLSALFLGTLLLAGLQSCKHADENGAIAPSPYDYAFRTQSKYAEGDYNIASTYLEFSETIRASRTLTQLGTSSSRTYYYDLYAENDYHEFMYTSRNNDSNIFTITNLRYTFVLDGSDYLFVNLQIRYNDRVIASLVTGNVSTGYIHVDSDAFSIFSDDNISRLAGQSVLLKTSDNEYPAKFAFNKDYNYNAPIDNNRNVPFGKRAEFTTHSFGFIREGTDAKSVLYVGKFQTNGMEFDTIESHYFYPLNNTDVVYVVDNNNAIASIPINKDYYIYVYMAYVNSETNDKYIVNQRDKVTFTDNDTINIAYANTTTWENDAFRYLEMSLKPNVETLERLQRYNNNNDFYNNGYYNSNDTNVFTLLAGAFGAVASVLNITILPYITIGMLIFVPIIVTIIIVVVHTLKK